MLFLTVLDFSTLDEHAILCFNLIGEFRTKPNLYHIDISLLRIEVSYPVLNDTFKGHVVNFHRLIDESPEMFINAMGAAICEVYYEQIPLATPVPKLTVRLLNNSNVQPFRQLKAFQIGKFVTIQGNIQRVTTVQPLATQLHFKCAKCLQDNVNIIKDGTFTYPAKCVTYHCNSKVFTIDYESPRTKFVNLQRIKVQEILDALDVEEEGRVPRLLDAELTNDLVDSIVPGEMVVLSGILKATEGLEKIHQGTPLSLLYLEVNSIRKAKMDESLTTTDAALMPQISNLLTTKNLLCALINSFCPHIYGNQMVKFGLLLGLVGGTRKKQGNFSIRSDPHILIVGDPGLGKSQLLRFASSISPRAVYVSANTSTAVGLTATVQDGGLEAGALVLADQGCCCIDEFDKIGTDGWRSLLDAMEQQTVNIAKAGIVCTLPARATILAAANPINGHYNKTKSVVDNLKMNAALLSRFDLIFIILDRPNADMDKMLSDHVLGNYQGKGVIAGKMGDPSTPLTPSNTTMLHRLSQPYNGPLISESTLRSFLGHVRDKVHPRMTEEATEVIQKFYLEIRQQRIIDESLPVTTRHLEALIRLSEARAKLELRTFVTCQDVQDIIELIKYSSADAQSESSKMFSRPSKKGSKSGAMKKYVTELIKISSRTGEVDFTTEQLQVLYTALGPGVGEIIPFKDLLDTLNEGGYVLRKQSGYRLLVT